MKKEKEKVLIEIKKNKGEKKIISCFVVISKI